MTRQSNTLINRVRWGNLALALALLTLVAAIVVDPWAKPHSQLRPIAPRAAMPTAPNAERPAPEHRAPAHERPRHAKHNLAHHPRGRAPSRSPAGRPAPVYVPAPQPGTADLAP